MILNNKEHLISVDGKIYHCPIDVSMHYIGGKWKAVAMWYLHDGPKRYSELRRLMSGITERMLSKQLQELEHDGLIVRHDYQEIPPHVDYALTEDGQKLLPALQALSDWSFELSQKRGTIVAARNEMSD